MRNAEILAESSAYQSIFELFLSLKVLKRHRQYHIRQIKYICCHILELIYHLLKLFLKENLLTVDEEFLNLKCICLLFNEDIRNLKELHDLISHSGLLQFSTETFTIATLQEAIASHDSFDYFSFITVT